MDGATEDRLVPLEAAARAWALLSAQTVEGLCGLTVVPWRVAAALHRHGMLPQSRLATLCHTHKVAISRAVEQLVEDQQWVMRLARGTDGRLRHLVLTERGRADVAGVAEALADLRHLCLADISDSEIAQMHDLARRVEEGVRRARHMERPRRRSFPQAASTTQAPPI